MKQFQELLANTDYLLGPNGCPWDQVQTMKSTRPCVIEEAAEVVDAIDSDDPHEIVEELGDLFFVVLFLCRLAEKEGKCSLEQVLAGINEKLIRRHPHVFGENGKKLHSSEDVLKQWGEIKKQEKGKTKRKGVFDGIPTGLPALAKAQKVATRLKENPQTIQGAKGIEFADEETLGALLMAIVAKAGTLGLDAEHALRLALLKLEMQIGQHP